jgi:hypothetical protein
MKASTVVVKVVIAWATLVLIQVVLGSVITSAVVLPKNVLPWFLLSTLLVAAVVVGLGMRSDWPTPLRAVALAAIPAVIMLNNFLEGIIFLTNTAIDWRKEILRTCLLNLIALPVWMILFRKSGDAEGSHYRPLSRPVGEKVWKFALADVAYPFLYLSAGMIIFPYVRDFYATQTLPPMSEILGVQLFIRGPILVAICLVMTRMLGLARWSGAVVVGLMLCTLNGIAPLIIPSGVFPDTVRWAHFFETAISNFVFGAFVAWLWGRPAAVAQAIRKAA